MRGRVRHQFQSRVLVSGILSPRINSFMGCKLSARSQKARCDFAICKIEISIAEVRQIIEDANPGRTH